jgi:hypothetical protein
MLLRVVSDPASPGGFALLDEATGRPVSHVHKVEVEKAYSGPGGPVPQVVKVTFVGIPVEMRLPEWGSYMAAQRAAAEQARRAQEAAQAAQGVKDAPPVEAANNA